MALLLSLYLTYVDILNATKRLQSTVTNQLCDPGRVRNLREPQFPLCTMGSPKSLTGTWDNNYSIFYNVILCSEDLQWIEGKDPVYEVRQKLVIQTLKSQKLDLQPYG